MYCINAPPSFFLMLNISSILFCVTGLAGCVSTLLHDGIMTPTDGKYMIQDSANNAIIVHNIISRNKLLLIVQQIINHVTRVTFGGEN